MPPRSLKRRLPPPPRPRQRNLTEKSSIARITQGGGKKGQEHGCRTRMHNISLAGFTRGARKKRKSTTTGRAREKKNTKVGRGYEQRGKTACRNKAVKWRVLWGAQKSRFFSTQTPTPLEESAAKAQRRRRRRCPLPSSSSLSFCTGREIFN